MKLVFSGAAHEVTGSCHYINACGKNIILDCGMEQGRDIYENQEIPVAVTDLDYVFLSHAHIDHSGYLPLIYKNGFKGKIFTTEATADLCTIMLRDSAHIQEFEAEWRNRKAKRSLEKPLEPLYTVADAEGVLQLFQPCSYEERINVCEGIDIQFTDIGHLLGSSSIKIWLSEDGITKTLVFSGDIGNIDQPLIEDPKYTDEADYVIMESTYGNRYHGEKPDYYTELAHYIQDTFDAGGNLVIPAFAVGRTQELLYFIRKIKEDKIIKGHEGFKVYVDSPLAIEATKVFNENTVSFYDDEALELIRKGINPISFEGLQTSVSSDDSKAINFDKEPKVIISASGMCEAGRIRHHLKHNLWREESTILFVGYQAYGTLGRTLIEGAESVKLFGEKIGVNAKIAQLNGISGHADKQGLLNWINGFKVKPKRVFVVHGDDTVTDEFADCLVKEYGYDAFAPYSGAEFDMLTNTIISKGVRKLVEQKETEVSKGAARGSALYKELEAASSRLKTIIANNKGSANSDLEKLISRVNELCDELDKK
ncbi:MAG: MBL fold metallo-hydrolase [Candidatus Metalachnospira sp.]|nr:MBL fold metallo-hydrolase [Candidatus Metalachnospira sp.]